VAVIKCTLAAISAGLDLPPQLLSALQSTIPAKYQAASGDVIQLTMDVWANVPPLPAKVPVTAFQLHDLLTTITGNSATGQHIAVLLTTSYNVQAFGAAANALGVMFDRGFQTPDDQNPPMQHPRLGCAIFLDTIKAFRSSSDYANEVLFTTLHELGHVFNLQHIEDPKNIMSSSGVTTINPTFWDFETPHKIWLGNCGNDQRVTPGQTNFMWNASFRCCGRTI